MNSKNYLHAALTQSASDFLNVVWPEARALPLIGGGTIRTVEDTAHPDFKVELDLIAGIDAWHIGAENGYMRGLGSRVQWGLAYNTFTIRYKVPTGQPTEFAKRLLAIQNKDNGYLYPHLSIQAFLDRQDGDLLSCAAVKTEELILLAADIVSSGAAHRNGCRDSFGLQRMQDGTEFLFLTWNFLVEHRVLLHENVVIKYSSPS